MLLACTKSTCSDVNVVFVLTVLCFQINVMDGFVFDSIYRPVAGYVNLCPESISTAAHDIHQMHSTIKHEILHALVGYLYMGKTHFLHLLFGCVLNIND